MNQHCSCDDLPDFFNRWNAHQQSCAYFTSVVLVSQTDRGDGCVDCKEPIGFTHLARCGIADEQQSKWDWIEEKPKPFLVGSTDLKKS